MSDENPAGKPSLREIFLQALEIASLAERQAYLERACQGNAALQARVQALLAAHDAPDTVPVAPEAAAGATLKLDCADKPDEAVGQTLGRYKLLERVGEGGYGVVYVAEQTEPVRRRVALKVIKLGMDTKQVVARFEAERQALAMMDHPNIAKVLDAGTTDVGRPYFVMELVRGIRITDYCDQAKLSTPERLDLFIKVCQAIQHAHQKGIIHRDIKPSNILVTLHDGVPVPKVIDFGIAKATEGRLTEATVYTQLHQFMGTPAYMSPEQAEMSGLDIDTRSDIYSLGVLLYQLLTSKTPFDGKELLALGLDEMRRTIRETEPMRPSTRLATLQGDELTVTARRHSADAPKLIQLVKDDLDWIVMKCLEKDRTRRYETANGLATDLKRHLANEPVVACPPSAAYRFRKMIRRNRSAALTTVMVAVTLILALAFSTTAFLRERKARLQATAAEVAREEPRQRADLETVRANSVAKYVTGFLDAVIPDLDHRGHSDAVQRLLQVADYFASALTNAPIAEGQIRLNIGMGYSGTLMNDFPKSVPQFLAAERLLGGRGPLGLHLAALAKSHRIGAVMWQTRDTNAAADLLQLGRDSLIRSIPDTEVAALSIANVSHFNAYFGNMKTAGSQARDVLRFAPADSVHQIARMVALSVWVAAAAESGADAEAEQGTLELFKPLLHPGTNEGSERRFLQELSKVIIQAPISEFPERSLRQTLDSIPERAIAARHFMEERLAASVAKRGDWKEALDLLRLASAAPDFNVRSWYAMVGLSGLMEDNDHHTTLLAFGQIRFANGADTESRQMLVEPLLILSPNKQSIAIARELLGQNQEGPPWISAWQHFPLALLEYRAGELLNASKQVDTYISAIKALGVRLSVPRMAKGWYLQSAIEAEAGHVQKAQFAYRQGESCHSPAFRKAGEDYTGEDWSQACAAELLRRQAASLLGGETPSNPQPPKAP